MGVIFNKLQIYGWSQEKENLLLATMISGERALLISPPGAAKTLLPKKLSKALGLSFAPFDLNAVAFEDIMGVLDIPALQKGDLKYLAAPGTIWNKQFVVYEEINRTRQNIQGKILEHLRSGTINGMPTGTLWCWSNMNPLGSEGTNKVADAIVDRFCTFIWAPDALDMNPEDMASIARTVSDSDAPAMPYWLKKFGASDEVISKVKDTTNYEEVGKILNEVLSKGANFYVELEKELKTLPEFLASFAGVLLENTSNIKDDKTAKAPLRLSGRRIGFMRRAILSYIAIERALDAVLGTYPTNLQSSVLRAINASIPHGINESENPNDNLRIAISSAVKQSWHRLEETDDKQAALITKLLVSRDPIERATILLSGELKNESAVLNGWQKISTMNTRSSNLLSFVAIQLDAALRAAGKTPILPSNILDIMKRSINGEHIKPTLPPMPGQLVPYIKDINDLIDNISKEDPVQGIVAIETVNEFVVESPQLPWKDLSRKIAARREDYQELAKKAGL